MQLVHFTHPLSTTKFWEGQLHIWSNVEGFDVEVTKVVLEDKNGRKTDITDKLEEYGFDRKEIEFMSLNDAENTDQEQVEFDDYTLANQ